MRSKARRRLWHHLACKRSAWHMAESKINAFCREFSSNPHSSFEHYFTFPELWLVTIRLHNSMLTDDYFAPLIASCRKANLLWAFLEAKPAGSMLMLKLSSFHLPCTEIIHSESKKKSKDTIEHTPKTRHFCLNELLSFRNYDKLISLNKGLF